MKVNRGSDAVSARQLSNAALFSALAALAGFAPAGTALAAGSAAWLSPLFALPPAVGVVFLLQYLCRRRPGEALDQIFYTVWGGVAGRGLLCLYALWCVLHACFALRDYTERIQAAMFPQAGAAFLALPLLALCFWAMKHQLRFLTRAAAVFLGLAAVALAAMVLLALGDIRPGHLLPVDPPKTLAAAGGGVALLGPLGATVYAAFLSGRVSDRYRLGAQSVRPLIVTALIASGLIAFTVGILGAPLTARLQNPFLTAVKNISGLEGGVRFESILTALWALPSFVFIALMGLVALTLLASVLKVDSAALLAGPVCLLIYAGSRGLAVYAGDAARLYQTWVPYGDVLLQYAVPVMTFGVGRLRIKN
ncbi:MAG: spore germination protein [Oscillospiraceae bacterium]|jgi:hypothetical protein|nr:spore germination protein [Oscillospiraceae bacterium]